jgi:DNA-binding NarL/FixJ family response regulator
MAIRVVLADDHAVVRDGLRLILEAQGDVAVVGEAGNGRSAVRESCRQSADVVIMDIAMPELNGVEATRQIRESHIDTRVVILSMHATSEHIFQALKAGALGYLLKESAGQEIVDAVRTVYAGRRYLSQRIAETVVEDYILRSESSPRRSPLETLSSREREVLQLVVEGKSSARIAEIIHLSPKSVETYRSRLMRKLGIRDIPSLVKFAIEHGVTPVT